MGKTLEDAGMLVKDGDGNLKVSDPTTRKFLEVRNNLIDNGDPGLPFPCVKSDKNESAGVLKIFWEDKEKYPAFFKKWVDGILLNQLKNLNVDGNIMLPVYDPLAMGAKLEVKNLPNLPLPTLIGALAMPPGTPLPLLLLNLSFPDALKLSGKIPGLLSPPTPPIPKLPAPIDVEFPGLAFEPVDFSLLGKHLGLNLALPKMFGGLLGEVASISFLAKFSPPGLFELGCKTVSKAMPPPPGPNMGSYTLNYQAVTALMAEAMSYSVLGSVIGSADTGIVGRLGAQGKHRDPPPPPDEEKTMSDLFEAGEQPGFWQPAVPRSRWVDPISIWDNPKGEYTGWKLRIKETNLEKQEVYVNNWPLMKKVVQLFNDNNKHRLITSTKQIIPPFTELHAQIMGVILGNESSFGQRTGVKKHGGGDNGGQFNYAGIECSKDKNGKYVNKSVGFGNCNGKEYADFPSKEAGYAQVFSELKGRGGIHLTKTNGLSVPLYLLANGPADKDEPGINDDRATFYRVMYALRRPPIYYEGIWDDTLAWKKYDGNASHKYFAQPEGKGGIVMNYSRVAPEYAAPELPNDPESPTMGQQLFSQLVELYTESGLTHLRAALYAAGETFAMPKGTYRDAHAWWLSKFRPLTRLPPEKSGQNSPDWVAEFVKENKGPVIPWTPYVPPAENA